MLLKISDSNDKIIFVRGMPSPTKWHYASNEYSHFSINLLKQNRKAILWRISLSKFFFIILNELMFSGP